MIHFAWCRWHWDTAQPWDRAAWWHWDTAQPWDSLVALGHCTAMGQRHSTAVGQGSAGTADTWLRLLCSVHLCLSQISSEQLLPNIFGIPLEQRLQAQWQRDKWHSEWQFCCCVLLCEWAKANREMLLISTARGTRRLASPGTLSHQVKMCPLILQMRCATGCVLWGLDTTECWVGSAKRLQTGFLPQEQPCKLCRIHTGSDAMESAWLLSFQNQNNYVSTQTLTGFLLPTRFA